MSARITKQLKHIHHQPKRVYCYESRLALALFMNIAVGMILQWLTT
jgi:hypothetical protein